MADDLYADEASSAPAAEPAEGAEPAQTEAADPTEKGDAQEGILSKSIIPGGDCKVGEKIVMEVTRINDNGISVKFDRKEKGEPAEAAMPAGMGGGDGLYD